jgi:hypothetical protein
MIKCEECISFAICINLMTTTKGNDYGLGYYLHRNPWIETKCSYYQEVFNGSSNIESWNEFKRFILTKKGLIYDQV